MVAVFSTLPLSFVRRAKMRDLVEAAQAELRGLHNQLGTTSEMVGPAAGDPCSEDTLNAVQKEVAVMKVNTKGRCAIDEESDLIFFRFFRK